MPDDPAPGADLVIIRPDVRPVPPLKLPGGIVLELRRPSAIDWRTAEIKASRIVRSIQDGGELADAWSPSEELVGWELDPDQAEALMRWVLATCMAALVVTGWNVATASEEDDAPTEPDPVTEAGLRLLFSAGAPMVDPFLSVVAGLLPIRIGGAEGNG